MKIVLFADAHLIADTDPHKPAHTERACFKMAWPSFGRLLDRINAESPDLVLCLGDLVDWFSTENVEMALELMSRLHSPWWMTPGNHDLSAAPGTGPADHHAARAHWNGRGFDFAPRLLDHGSFRLLCCDSAVSALAPGVEPWIERSLRPRGGNLLATHVPVDTPSMRRWILDRDPGRDLGKYVQSRNPGLFDRLLSGRVDHIFTGHLHLPGRLRHRGVTFHLLNMSITTHDTWRDSSYVAEATVLRMTGRRVQVTTMNVQ